MRRRNSLKKETLLSKPASVNRSVFCLLANTLWSFSWKKAMRSGSCFISEMSSSILRGDFLSLLLRRK